VNQTRKRQLYEQSVHVLLENQQPGGAYLACPQMPDYRFSWFRDGAYIAYALTLEGQNGSLSDKGSMAAQWDSAVRFHAWCVDVINHRAAQIERCIDRARHGHPLVMADVLHTRYTAEGLESPDDWPDFQLDGLGTWLWSLSEFVSRTRLRPLPLEWEQAVTLVARYLAALWRIPCYDCWEERSSDIHISTLGAIYAGLVAAERLVTGLEAARVAAQVKEFVLAEGLTPGGELAKSVGLDMVDANLLSVAVPHGLLAPNDPIMQRTAARIERELHAPQSGVHRHLQDVYYGGGAWVLLALWLAWYDLEAGHLQRADELIAWSEDQADSENYLPEQVHAAMLAPEFYNEWVERRGPIANPLLWTHAKYLIVRMTRDGLGR
jgi:GH15 family glucan-1,4-alpha-glucosidase